MFTLNVFFDKQNLSDNYQLLVNQLKVLKELFHTIKSESF